jgi:hypothetical protein
MIEITHINDIPLEEYPVYCSMISSVLVRYSKWECAKYWQARGMNYNRAMFAYDNNIKAVNTFIFDQKLDKRLQPFQIYNT